MFKLMIKTHNVTGLKYLCKTIQADHNKYKGSGTYWSNHRARHGHSISTEVIYQTDDLSDFKSKCLYYSKLYNIVESEQWANLVYETGDGGVPPSRKGHKAKDKVLLKGNNRTYKQKAAALAHSSNQQGRIPSNRIAVTVNNIDYDSIAAATKALNLTYRELKKIISGS